jgi:hypothetical protein
MKTLFQFLNEGDVVKHKFADKLAKKHGIIKPRGPWEKDSIYSKYLMSVQMAKGDETTHYHDGVKVHHASGGTTFIKHGHELINPDLTYHGEEPVVTRREGSRAAMNHNAVVANILPHKRLDYFKNKKAAK